MSLCPEDYERAIGTVKFPGTEVLVFRDGKLMSQWPNCGHRPYTDPVRRMVFLPTWFEGEEDMIYPTVYEDGRDRSGSEELSKSLYEEIEKILKMFFLKEELKLKGLEPVTEDNYVANVLRTESCDMEPIKERLQNEETIRLLHAALGLVTEAAELADMLKKHIFYGRPIDWVNTKEEVGDAMWYVGVVVDVMKTTMREIKQVNIDKLRARFPDKFTEKDANNRDLDAEHKILSGEIKDE